MISFSIEPWKSRGPWDYSFVSSHGSSELSNIYCSLCSVYTCYLISYFHCKQFIARPFQHSLFPQLEMVGKIYKNRRPCTVCKVLFIYLSITKLQLSSLVIHIWNHMGNTVKIIPQKGPERRFYNFIFLVYREIYPNNISLLIKEPLSVQRDARIFAIVHVIKRVKTLGNAAETWDTGTFLFISFSLYIGHNEKNS